MSKSENDMCSREGLVVAIEQSLLLSPSLRAAFLAVDRRLFVTPHYEYLGTRWVQQETPLASIYTDRPLVTKLDEVGMPSCSISMPSVMAAMLEALDLQPGQRALEIGTDTGYNAALLNHLVGENGQVVSVDIDETLIGTAREHLALAGAYNVQVINADGLDGFPGLAPYDCIIATGGFRRLPPAWQEQLAPGGIVVGNHLGLLASVLVRLAKQEMEHWLAACFLNQASLWNCIMGLQNDSRNHLTGRLMTRCLQKHSTLLLISLRP